MNSQLASLYFKLKTYEKSGADFQLFFSNLMRAKDPDFVTVKPHGNWGDGGNDGCNLKTKNYYQVYAPLATTNSNPITELNKAIEDFTKLQDKWGAVVGYHSVINDRFTGTSAKLLNEFDIFTKEQGLEGRVVDSQMMLQIFNELDDKKKLQILDMWSLEGTDDDFDPSMLGELINYLVENSGNRLDFFTGGAPIFDEKIEFNNLTKSVASRIESNSFKTYLIDDFLTKQNNDSISQQLSITVNIFYERSCKEIPETATDRTSLIYLSLLEKITPEFAKKNKINLSSYESLAEIIIAKYFETCDVYEDPNSNTTS